MGAPERDARERGGGGVGEDVGEEFVVVADGEEEGGEALEGGEGGGREGVDGEVGGWWVRVGFGFGACCRFGEEAWESLEEGGRG